MIEFKPNETSIIRANTINIGDGVYFGDNTNIDITGNLNIGDYSYFVNGVIIRGNNCSIGKHFFTMAHNNQILTIGGGGSSYNDDANIKIGDRCVFHNNHINIAKEINIGDDVGLSPNVDIITHGFWYSVLEGYPRKFEGVNIGNNVIVGWSSKILMGVNIVDNCIIGANSTVSKSLLVSGIYAGSPSVYIKNIAKPSDEDRNLLLLDIINEFNLVLNKFNIKSKLEKIDVNIIRLNDFYINVADFSYHGSENQLTHNLRDFLRKYGIRIYTENQFSTKWTINE